MQYNLEDLKPWHSKFKFRMRLVKYPQLQSKPLLNLIQGHLCFLPPEIQCFPIFLAVFWWHLGDLFWSQSDRYPTARCLGFGKDFGGVQGRQSGAIVFLNPMWTSAIYVAVHIQCTIHSMIIYIIHIYIYIYVYLFIYVFINIHNSTNRCK